MKAWPFLFSRGYVLDNQLIVCPKVLQNGRWGEFSRIVARLTSELSQDIKVDEIENPKVGNITLIYRANHAIRRGQTASDVAGRSVRMIRGVMIEGRSSKLASVAATAVMDRVAPLLDAEFEAFWDQNEETGPKFADGFEIGAADSQRSDDIRPTDRAKKAPNAQQPARSTSWKRTTALALAVLVPYALLGALLYGHYAKTAKKFRALEMGQRAQHDILINLNQEIDKLKKMRNAQ